MVNGSGVIAGRTWIIAPDLETLSNAGTAFSAKTIRGEEELFHPHEGSKRHSDRARSDWDKFRL